VLAVNGAVETWISYRATRTTLTDAMTEKAEATAKRIDQSISDWTADQLGDAGERRDAEQRRAIFSAP